MNKEDKQTLDISGGTGMPLETLNWHGTALEREPLTDEEIEDIWVATDVPILGATYIKLVRQIEKAHGIGETHD